MRASGKIATLGMILILAAGTLAQDAATRVDQIFEDLSLAESHHVWDLAWELDSLGPNAANHIKKGLVHASPAVRLVSAKTLLGHGAERDLAVKALVGVLNPAEEVSNEFRLIASELLFLHGEKNDVRPLTGYFPLTHDPYVKISLAKVLRKRNRDADAMPVLKKYLESDDFSVRAAAALALAEIGNAEAAKPVLDRLSKEPTDRGTLARKYLEIETLLSSIEATQTLGQDAQIAALREQISQLQGEIKDLKAAARQGAGGGGEGGGGEFPVLSEVLKKIDQFYVTDENGKLDREKLMDAAMKGLVSSLDPFSSYMTKAEWDKFIESMSQEYAGIGAYVNKDPKDGYLVISRPFYKGPAYRAGLRSLDKIVEVEGVSTHNLGTDEIISKLKGKPGTPVKIKVFRRGWDQAQDYEIVRENIEVQSVYVEMLPGNVGYISLTQFGQDTAREVANALKELQKQGMVALVIDLRNNGGGYLNAAVEIADNFLPAGKVVCYSEGRNKIISPYTEHKTKKAVGHDVPMVVLVNGASASASEIVSGALQDHGRALLVGNKTFGKGSVQQLLQLESSAGRLRLTIARYFLPSGRSIHEVGVTPDVDVPLPEIPVWKREAVAKIETVIDDYVFKHYAANKELFAKLAVFDNYDPAAYPEFDAFFKGLNTELSPEDVRQVVRGEARRLVQDERSKLFATDLQSDEQLQRAIYELATRNSLPWESVPEYSRFITKIREALAASPKPEDKPATPVETPKQP